MKHAVSNLAFENIHEIADVKLLECVFSKIGPILDLETKDIVQWKSQLPENIIPYSVQAITYNTGIEIIKYNTQCVTLVDKILSFAKELKLKRIVFGSPKLRKNTPPTDLFKYIENQLAGTDLLFCIEPNAKIYGGDYFLNIQEIYEYIKENNFKNISTMIDTHCSWLENRDTEKDIIDYKDLITHVHASEVGLQEFKSFNEHREVAAALQKINYQHVITLESNSIRNIDMFVKIYQ